MEALIPILYLFRRGRKNDVLAPDLSVVETVELESFMPFGKVEGKIHRSQLLDSERCGDAIFKIGNTIFVVDASAPDQDMSYLKEQQMVQALKSGLENNSNDLMAAINGALTSGGREQWNGTNVEFGLSVSGITSNDNGTVTLFNIGTGTVYVDGKTVLPSQKKFHSPNPMPGSKKVGTLEMKKITMPSQNLTSVLIHTDGFLAGLKIAGDAKEATYLKLEK